MAYRALRCLLIPVGIGFFLVGASDNRSTQPSLDQDIIQRGTFTDDRDGTSYGWLQIESQVWMAENLNYHTDAGSWCYENDARNCEEYGRLYDWQTALSSCPTGWRLPSDEDWDTLVTTVGQEPGTQLKESGSTGFDAKMSGYRFYDGGYSNLGMSAGFWTSNVWLDDHARDRSLSRTGTDLQSGGFGQVGALSVRCLRSEAAPIPY